MKKMLGNLKTETEEKKKRKKRLKELISTHGQMEDTLL